MRRLLLAGLACAALAGSAAALDVPYLSGRVNDDARLFDADAAQNLEQTLKAYEEKTGRQFVVLTIPALGDEAFEDYSIEVARAWKLGAKGKDDGILLLIARDDHKVRIEVGYGLEGALPDALCGRIVRDEIVPRFRAGDYAGGTAAGVDAVLKTLDGTYSPPPDPARGGRGARPEDMSAADKLLASLLVLAMLGLFESAGIFAPGTGWFLYFFLIPFWAAFPMGLWGMKFGLAVLGAHLIGFPILKLLLPRTGWGKAMSKRYVSMPSGGRYIGGSGWSSGGGGGGWSSGGGGGFSGGGGSFGGGGASGSW